MDSVKPLQSAWGSQNCGVVKVGKHLQDPGVQPSPESHHGHQTPPQNSLQTPRAPQGPLWISA